MHGDAFDADVFRHLRHFDGQTDFSSQPRAA